MTEENRDELTVFLSLSGSDSKSLLKSVIIISEGDGINFKLQSFSLKHIHIETE